MTTYSTQQSRHEAKRRNQRFVEMAVEGRRSEANYIVVTMTDFLQSGISVGLDRAYLSDTARGFHDAITKLQAAMNKDLDEAGLQDTVCLDLSELDALIAEIDKP